MFPEEFIKRLHNQTYIDSGILLRALTEPSPVSLRLNPAKWTRRPAGALPVKWCSQGWYIRDRPAYTLDPLFHAGCYYPQEASGMFIGEIFRQLFNDRAGLKVLDLCGAPGGKSTHLSSLIGSNGILISNEVIKSRAVILAENITKWGCSNTIVTSSDPSAFSEMKGYFDLVLADLPCSGEGMFRDRTALEQWSPANATHCSERQRRIVRDIWPSLKQDGILIYCTCTFNPAENEENVQWLKQNMGADHVVIDIGCFPGIKEITYEGVNGYGFYPGMIEGEGLFIAALRKGDKEVYDTERNRKPIPKESGRKEDLSIFSGWLVKEPAAMLRERDRVYALPVSLNEYMNLVDRLNIIKRGIEVFTWKNGEPVPSHEFVLSDLIAPGLFQSVELDYSSSVCYLRKEIPDTGNPPPGWITVKYRGKNLGLMKNIGKRLNNYYPVNWRIRMKTGSGLSVSVPEWD